MMDKGPSFSRVLEIGIGEAPNVPYYPTGSKVTGTHAHIAFGK